MTFETTRREAFLYLASAAGALAIGGARSAYAHGERPSSPLQKGATSMTGHDMTACIDECEACHRVCAETVRYCLEKGGRHAAPEHVGLLIDCAEICQTSANFMMRGSAAHKTVCGACAEICERCADSCDGIPGDAQLTACAKACRACAESCRNMAAD